MKKIVLAFIIGALVISLSACGSADVPADEVPTPSQSEISEDTVGPDAQDGGETEQPECCIELSPESIFISDGDYELDGFYTDILTDRSVREGWFYYYSEGTDPKVPWKEWKCGSDMYTSCEIYFTVTNLSSEMEESFTERATGFIAFDVPSDFDPLSSSADGNMASLRDLLAEYDGVEISDYTPLQENPGQTDTDGYLTRSVDGVKLGEGETVRLAFIADVSEKFYRSWEDENGTENMWAFIGFGDGRIFCINLREWLLEY